MGVGIINNGEYYVTCSLDKIVKIIDGKTGIDLKTYEIDGIPRCLDVTTHLGKDYIAIGSEHDTSLRILAN